jgi:hypothetical protein
MRIEYRPTYLDFLLFNNVHQFLSPTLQLLYIGLSIFTAVTMPDDLPKAQLVAIGFIVFFSLWLLQFVLNAIYLYSKKNRSFLTEHLMEVRDDGLLDQTKFAQSLSYWSGEVRVVTRPGFVAVYVSAFAAFIVPNRTFVSNDQRDAFISSIRERILRAKGV